MDKTQKNREPEGNRRPQQGTKTRPASAEEQQARRKEAQRSAAQKSAEAPREARQKRPAQQEAAPRQEARKRPAQQEAAPRQEPRKRPAQQKAAPQREAQKRPAQQRERSAETAGQVQQPRTQRPAQQSSGQRQNRDPQTVMQGGPHERAAKQRSPQEQRAARQRSAQKRAPERTVKKNSLQSFISGFRGGKERSEDQEAKANERRRKRAAEAERKRKQAERNNTPAIIYTAPQAFNRNRLLVQLTTVLAVVVALIMGLSVFFKVEQITVAGANVYGASTVSEASGIQKGDNLLTFSRERASAQIHAELSYVEKVRIGIKLPDTVIIYIEEAEVAYAIQSSDGTWWLMTSAGRVTEEIDGASKENYTQVLGVTLLSPEKGAMAMAREDVPEVDENGETVPATVTAAMRLSAALQILSALEANDIVGEAASVDVSRLDDIILWYGTRYQVNLGDINDFNHTMADKIACMNDAILQLSDYQSGILDISFTTWPDQVGYTPFG